MNKTLMLVICDFLLLSMLALARFDTPEQTPEPTLDVTDDSGGTEAELVALLEESLQAEQASRSGLSRDLESARSTLSEKARLLEERESALEATRTELESKSTEAERLGSEKARIEAEQRRLAEEKAQVESERESIVQKFEQTREALDSEKTERIRLAETLGQLKEESSVARERLTRSEEELIAREIALAEREAALKAAEEEKTKLAAEREALARQLEVTKAEQRMLAENLSKEQLEKQLIRQEKEEAFARADRLGENVSQLGQGVNLLGENVTQLGQGVNLLGENVTQLGQGVSEVAATSENIRKEMEESRPQTMSQIFTRFQNNRALIRFNATEKGLFGARNERSYETKSILVDGSDGSYLVAHAAHTPFDFGKTSGSLLDVELEVTLGDRRFPVDRVGFLAGDPRLLFIPLPGQYVEASGLETFELAKQPERWEEAVLVKHDESNFGRTQFRRLTTSERFLKMDRPALGELFADFASSRGDLAFTKNSRFIGVLANKAHAVVLDDFLASAVVELGADFDPDATANTLDRLKDRLRQLPDDVR